MWSCVQGLRRQLVVHLAFSFLPYLFQQNQPHRKDQTRSVVLDGRKVAIMVYTPNGYIVPAEFGVHFLPRMKNIPKQAKLHLNEIGLTNIEFCKRQI